MARNIRATHNQHLRDSEVATKYLSEALEEGDAAVILMALRKVTEAQEDRYWPGYPLVPRSGEYL